jgi:hypothetical protein
VLGLIFPYFSILMFFFLHYVFCYFPTIIFGFGCDYSSTLPV